MLNICSLLKCIKYENRLIIKEVMTDNITLPTKTNLTTYIKASLLCTSIVN